MTKKLITIVILLIIVGVGAPKIFIYPDLDSYPIEYENKILIKGIVSSCLDNPIDKILTLKLRVMSYKKSDNNFTECLIMSHTFLGIPYKKLIINPHGGIIKSPIDNDY